jgi:SAM-dependent methyltransferase
MLHQSEFRHYLVPRIARIAAVRGFFLDHSCKVLDFGCGSGSEVYAWRKDGFDAHGYDMHRSLQLREPADQQYFKVGIDAKGADATKYDTRIGKDYRLPYEDNTFDLVLSYTVLEHVIDLDPVFQELARVMKPRSIGVHTFPAKYTLIEPHMKVPLASFFQPYWWFWLWAQLGLKNDYQTDNKFTKLEVAKLNLNYSRVGLSYKNASEIMRIADRYFSHTGYMPEYWEYPSKEFSRIVSSGIYRKFYNNCKYSVLVTERVA